MKSKILIVTTSLSILMVANAMASSEMEIDTDFSGKKETYQAPPLQSFGMPQMQGYGPKVTAKKPVDDYLPAIRSLYEKNKGGSIDSGALRTSISTLKSKIQNFCDQRDPLYQPVLRYLSQFASYGISPVYPSESYIQGIDKAPAPYRLEGIDEFLREYFRQ